uniref:Uncharacterized protein n=1 Tax=Globodera rostochiensis TaxID=31243 RepID=A0A914HDW7_GLORO
MAPLPSLFALLCSIAVLLVRCNGLKCKGGGLDFANKVTDEPVKLCQDVHHYCIGAHCIKDDKSDNVFSWGCYINDDGNECATNTQKLLQGTWTCKCFFGKKDVDMDNKRFSKANGDVRFSLKTLMAMPPLLLGFVVPIVPAAAALVAKGAPNGAGPRLCVNMVMALPPLILGIVVPIVRANLLRPF